MKRGELAEERERGRGSGCTNEPKLALRNELEREPRNVLEPELKTELELGRQRRGKKEHWGCTSP